MDVTFSVAICASVVAIADGTCSKENALQVLEKPLHLIDAAQPGPACAHEAYGFLLSFPRPDGGPLTVSWTCSARATARPGADEVGAEGRAPLTLSAAALREDPQPNRCSGDVDRKH
jgi:hypothetical protein